MKFFVITIFPEMLSALRHSILGKAIEKGIIELHAVNPRDFARDRHKTVDDEPYGGGAGMVMKPEPLVEAIKSVRESSPEVKVLLLTPKGVTFSQRLARRFAKEKALCLVCGRYEGVDERVRFFVDMEISIGDFVLSGGELAALCIVDAVARLVPGVLGCEDSLREESFSDDLLEYPQFTRPRVYEGYAVPEVLLSGNHALIEDWRRFKRLEETLFRRPDLLARASLSDEDKRKLTKIIRGEKWNSS